MGGTVSVLPQPTDRLAAGIRRVQGTAPVGQTLDTLPALADLLPGGALRAGAAYSVTGSTTLAMAVLAGPSAGGAWCGVVGMPGFAAEAAHHLGVDLDRLILVPEPGRGWLGVVGALVDALTVVVVRPPTAVRDAEASRIAARLRQRDAVLVSCGPWPRCEAQLSVTESHWTGVGHGHGHLQARQVTVTARGRGTASRPRDTRLWLPDAAGRVRGLEEDAGARELDAGADPAWLHEATG